MNRKKLFIIVFVFILLAAIVFFISQNISIRKNTDEEISEYTPEEEISDKQLRETTISLYFLDNETNKLKSEGKLIDANELLKNPYKIIVQKLLEGPSDEKLKSVFPENTRLIDANLSGNCVVLNFSEEILKFEDDTQKFNIINSLLNSLAQLNEVNSIRILVNNETVDEIEQEFSVIS